MCPTLSSSSAILSALQRSSSDTTLWHEITSTTTHMKTGPRKCEHGILWNISLTGDILYDGSKYTEQYYAQQEFVDGETTRLFRPSVRPSRRETHFLFDRNTTHDAKRPPRCAVAIHTRKYFASSRHVASSTVLLIIDMYRVERETYACAFQCASRPRNRAFGGFNRISMGDLDHVCASILLLLCRNITSYA